jgi:nitrogen fixation/metabolism regulation signal transduction histidine kinase
MRHELKQKDILRFQREIIQTKKEVEAKLSTAEPEREALLQQLSRLLDYLDDHISRLRDSIEEIRLMDTEAKPKTFDLYKLLLELREEYLSRISKARYIDIEIDETLRDKEVYCDRDHLKLVFRNLFSNSFRATEKRVTSNWQANLKKDSPEIIKVELFTISDEYFTLLFTDNGCGILPEIRDKLYVERCSDQKGRDHGLGGVIIRKLLDLSGGSICIEESNREGNNIGTIQKILLHRGARN